MISSSLAYIRESCTSFQGMATQATERAGLMNDSLVGNALVSSVRENCMEYMGWYTVVTAMDKLPDGIRWVTEGASTATASISAALLQHAAPPEAIPHGYAGCVLSPYGGMVCPRGKVTEESWGELLPVTLAVFATALPLACYSAEDSASLRGRIRNVAALSTSLGVGAVAACCLSSPEGEELYHEALSYGAAAISTVAALRFLPLCQTAGAVGLNSAQRIGRYAMEILGGYIGMKCVATEERLFSREDPLDCYIVKSLECMAVAAAMEGMRSETPDYPITRMVGDLIVGSLVYNAISFYRIYANREEIISESIQGLMESFGSSIDNFADFLHDSYFGDFLEAQVKALLLQGAIEETLLPVKPLGGPVGEEIQGTVSAAIKETISLEGVSIGVKEASTAVGGVTREMTRKLMHELLVTTIGQFSTWFEEGEIQALHEQLMVVHQRGDERQQQVLLEQIERHLFSRFSATTGSTFNPMRKMQLASWEEKLPSSGFQFDYFQEQFRNQLVTSFTDVQERFIGLRFGNREMAQKVGFLADVYHPIFLKIMTLNILALPTRNSENAERIVSKASAQFVSYLASQTFPSAVSGRIHSICHRLSNLSEEKIIDKPMADLLTVDVAYMLHKKIKKVQNKIESKWGESNV